MVSTKSVIAADAEPVEAQPGIIRSQPALRPCERQPDNGADFMLK